VIVSYGMTLGPKLPYSMPAVLKQIEIRGSTMGSRAEFAQMVEFVREKQIRPVVSQVSRGIENLEGLDGLFECMKRAEQFGKLVVVLRGEENGKGDRENDGSRL